jgi:hypothetical protein
LFIVLAGKRQLPASIGYSQKENGGCEAAICKQYNVNPAVRLTFVGCYRSNGFMFTGLA